MGGPLTFYILYIQKRNKTKISNNISKSIQAHIWYADIKTFIFSIDKFDRSKHSFIYNSI